MGFPAPEMRMGGTHALVFTEGGQVLPRSVNTISGILFYVKNYGIYQLNKKNGLVFGRGRVYMHDQKMHNPINIHAFNKINSFLESENLPALSKRQIALLVNTVKPESNLDTLLQHYEKIGIKLDSTKMALLKDVVLDTAYEEKETLRKELGDDVVDWLNDYFSIDVIAHKSVRLKVLEDSDFKLKNSSPVAQWMFWERMFWTKEVALVVIDNRALDAVPCKTKTVIENGKAKTMVGTGKKYGDFEIEGNKNIYRYKRTPIHIAHVQSSEVTA